MWCRGQATPRCSIHPPGRDGIPGHVRSNRAGPPDSGAERRRRVVLAAGSLGTTELLLRCRDEYQTLPNVSRLLGQGWSSNANVLTPDQYATSTKVEQSIGPTISGGLDFMDGWAGGPRYYIEDDGFPSLMLTAVRQVADGRVEPLRVCPSRSPGPQGGRPQSSGQRASRGQTEFQVNLKLGLTQRSPQPR